MSGTPKPYDAKPYPPLKKEGPSLLSDEGTKEIDLTPVEFCEAAEMILESMEHWFDCCVTSKRYSNGYIDAVFRMIEVLRQAAGCCVTKAVREQDGESFPSLDHLDIDTMYMAASALFRKTHDAAMHFLKKGEFCAKKALSAELALFDMLKRLQATSERINIIREKKINTQKYLDKAQGHHTPDSGRKKESKPEENPVKKAVSYQVQTKFLKKQEEKGSPEKPPALPQMVSGSPFSMAIPQPAPLSELITGPIRMDLPPQGMPFPDLFSPGMEREKVPASVGLKADSPGRYGKKKKKRR